MPPAPAAEIGRLVDHARALVFDFDGTLVDSNPIKWRGFERCFAGFPERLPEIMEYCQGHHHTPREEKFRHVYERILRRPYTPEVEAKLLARFDEETTQRIIEAPDIPGATTFLSLVAGTHMTALLSSTPHEMLLEIVRRRSWLEHFDVVRGAPIEKGAWLRDFRAARRLGANDIVMFGDTEEDARAAGVAGCLFVAVGSAETPDERIRVKDFTKLCGRTSDRRR